MGMTKGEVKKKPIYCYGEAYLAIGTAPSFREPHGGLSVRAQRMVFSAMSSRSLDGEVVSIRA